MCGRYVSPDQAAIEREFSIQKKSWNQRMDLLLAESFEVQYNVAPTQNVPVIRVLRNIDGQREGLHMRWGLIPWFAKGEPPAYSTINARVETLDTAPAFKGAWQRSQRCVFPALGFYEWQVQADGKTRRPLFIRPVDSDKCFAIAGLWDRSISASGEHILSCAIITIPANELLAEIHNSQRRMPAILKPENVDVWLQGTPEQARAVLKPYPSEAMVAWPVSTRVNSTKNSDPALIEASREPV